MTAARNVYLSSGAFPSRKLADILSTAADWGVVNVELSSDVAPSADNIAIARRARRAHTFLLHNYFPAPARPFVLNLASADKENLDRSRQHCRKALEISAELEAPLFAAHAGFAAQLAPADLGSKFDPERATPRKEAYATFLDSVGDLVLYGKKLGVRFLVENNVVTKSNLRDGKNRYLLLADPEEIRLCASDIGDDFGMLVDTGHLKVSAQSLGFDPVDAMAAIDHCTVAYHLSDNDGVRDSNGIFSADAWFVPLLDRRRTATVEVYHSSQRDVESMLDLLEARQQ